MIVLPIVLFRFFEVVSGSHKGLGLRTSFFRQSVARAVERRLAPRLLGLGLGFGVPSLG